MTRCCATGSKKSPFGRAKCPWCGRRGHLIYLTQLSEPFRKVVEELYTEASGPEAFHRGDRIADLLDYDWGIFSEELVDDRQELVVAILTADLREKELSDYPDYESLFYGRELSLEEAWDEKASAVLTGAMPKPPNRKMMGEQRELFGPFEIVFEDLAVSFDTEHEGSLFRARRYDDREHKEKYTAEKVGAPPREKVKAGRANQAHQPILYLANNRSTALAEVRPWKGAAVAIAEVKVKQRLSLVDLSQVRPVKSPFFEDLFGLSRSHARLWPRPPPDCCAHPSRPPLFCYDPCRQQSDTEVNAQTSRRNKTSLAAGVLCVAGGRSSAFAAKSRTLPQRMSCCGRL